MHITITIIVVVREESIILNTKNANHNAWLTIGLVTTYQPKDASSIVFDCESQNTALMEPHSVLPVSSGRNCTLGQRSCDRQVPGEIGSYQARNLRDVFMQVPTRVY